MPSRHSLRPQLVDELGSERGFEQLAVGAAPPFRRRSQRIIERTRRRERVDAP
jgi:hypothetical protein